MLALLAPASAMAESPFDGTWKVDLSTAQMPTKPDVYLLKDGMYACKSCAPAISVKADGADHAVTGHPYFDTVAIKVVDDHTIQETDKKNGKPVVISTVTAAADGKTATFEFNDSSNTNAAPVSGKGTQTRVGAMPAGAHAISGSWHTTSFSNISDNGLTITYKTEGDMMTMMSPTGQKYTAKMDGTDSPMMGDPGITSVSVRKLGGKSIVETDKRDGKAIGVAAMTVAADGKSMKISYHDKLRGTSMSYSVIKQ